MQLSPIVIPSQEKCIALLHKMEGQICKIEIKD